MMNIEKYTYLKPDRTFKESTELITKKEKIITTSKSSPGTVARPTIIKPIRNKRNGFGSRAVSTSPQTPQLF